MLLELIVKLTPLINIYLNKLINKNKSYERI